jgi:hypothetical protein
MKGGSINNIQSVNTLEFEFDSFLNITKAMNKPAKANL